MRIYIASRYTRRAFFMSLAPSIEAVGYEITSRWITDPNDNLDFEHLTEAQQATLALRDLVDIQRAEVLVLDTGEGLAQGCGGGREFEAGYGLKVHDGQLWRVGPARSVFHQLATKAWDSWDRFMKEKH